MSRLSTLRALTAATAAGVLALAPAVPGSAAPQAPGPSPEPLDAVVTEKLLDRAGSISAFADAGPDDARVTISRSQGDWAFGTAVLVAPRDEADHHPQGWLFVAHRVDGAWTVAFEGESEFGSISKASPVLSASEREIFASHDGSVRPQANGDYRTGMRLPFATGQSWSMWGGPHGWGGYETPYSSLDLSGGDQVVRAPRAGTAYTMCQGWVRVVHDRGYATDHYHLWDNIWVDGAWVNEGAFLGYTGTDVTCGGSANGRHVHFALRQNGAYVGIAYHIIGQWVPMNGGSAYGGYALHGSQVVYVGGTLYNYGALGLNQGIVDTDGGGVLNKRSGPGTGYPIVGSVADGAVVTISCSANGTTHTGRWGTTSLWNRLSDGSWVSDAYLYTGSNNPINGWC